MTESIFINKPCPFYWKEGESAWRIVKFKDERTRKCILLQSKNNLQGEPGCVFHGSSPPACGCLGKYRSTDMRKIGSNLWECPLCQGRITGFKNQAGYLDFDYHEYSCLRKK